MCSIVWFEYKQTLLNSFDEQLENRAKLVAQKTSIQPKIVPLPQGEEIFDIFLIQNGQLDTLFISTFDRNNINILEATENSWREYNLREEMDSGATLDIHYYYPSDSINDKINHFQFVILGMLGFGFIFSYGIAYWLSKKLMSPLNKIISTTNKINLNSEIEIIPEPKAKDEIKDIIYSFNRMIFRIKEQSENQNAFFASASHELRTPLSNMKTQLQVIQKNTENSVELNQIIEDQLMEVDRLNNMVQGFLIMSELKFKNQELTTENVDISELITSNLKKFNLRAKGKQIKFQINLYPIDEVFNLYTDIEKLEHILNNLLDNAVKYAEENSIITILLKKSDVYEIKISNIIREGINPKLTDIKNKFYHSKPIDGEGFGLGLWISNQFSNLINAKLYFSIENKKTFIATLILPL